MVYIFTQYKYYILLTKFQVVGYIYIYLYTYTHSHTHRVVLAIYTAPDVSSHLKWKYFKRNSLHIVTTLPKCPHYDFLTLKKPFNLCSVSQFFLQIWLVQEFPKEGSKITHWILGQFIKLFS